MERKIAAEKAMELAIEIVSTTKTKSIKHFEHPLFDQLLRSVTSIGANLQEAQGAESKRDFLHKNSLAYKEARETEYWLKLFKETSDGIPQEVVSEWISLCDEIIRITGKTIASTRKNMSK